MYVLSPEGKSRQTVGANCSLRTRCQGARREGPPAADLPRQPAGIFFLSLRRGGDLALNQQGISSGCCKPPPAQGRCTLCLHQQERQSREAGAQDCCRNGGATGSHSYGTARAGLSWENGYSWVLPTSCPRNLLVWWAVS